MTTGFDLVLRDGLVVDGTGAPARRADVGVQGGRIAAVEPPGSLPAAAGETVSLRDLVLAPGFIDTHTHYDAQVTWDSDLTPSCWHGVTTVVMGNCGFGIAPIRRSQRSFIIKTLEQVEDMSATSLENGIKWSFETFPEYLDAIDRQPKRLNVAAFLGHTPLRIFVMGDDATRRAATTTEISLMRELVVEALDAGAVGFSTSSAFQHVGAEGKPVPSRLADFVETGALAGALRDVGHGIVQITEGAISVDEFAELSKTIGRPVTWTALVTGLHGRGWATGVLDRTEQLGGEVWPQISCRPLVMQANLADPFPYAIVPAFTEVLAVPAAGRAAVYRDPAWRGRARSQLSGPWNARWGKTTIAETRTHGHLANGPSLADIARERGEHPLDTLVDLSLADDLSTRFRIVLANDDDDELAQLLRDPRAVLGLSDAGAHASQLCDACFSTHLLGYWVREQGALTLEAAVQRLTGQAADVFGLPGRGVLRAGAVADLVAFDAETVAAGALERVSDLPGGADRLIVRSHGIEHVWVNGTAIRRSGHDVADAHPGRLIRGAAV